MFGAIRKLVKVQCRERRIVSIFGAAWCACRQKAKKAGGQRTDPKAKYGNRMRRWRQPRPGRGRVRVLTPPRFLHRLSIFALPIRSPFAPFPCPAYTFLTYRTHMISFHTLRTEFRPTLRLAIPLVLAELGWMSMAIVDTMMV